MDYGWTRVTLHRACGQRHVMSNFLSYLLYTGGVRRSRRRRRAESSLVHSFVRRRAGGGGGGVETFARSVACFGRWTAAERWGSGGGGGWRRDERAAARGGERRRETATDDVARGVFFVLILVLLVGVFRRSLVYVSDSTLTFSRPCRRHSGAPWARRRRPPPVERAF